jgi:two-component system response regulator VicR
MTAPTPILLVEDELALGLLVKESLEKHGYEVVHATDGEQALKAFFEYEPALVILDVMMPKVSGFDVAKTIRNTDRHTPIIFLTAKIKSEDVVKGFASGGNDYLRKPFAMEELLVRMQALLNEDRLAARLEASSQSIFEIGSYTFNSKQLRITQSNGTDQNLTAREGELLKLLCENPNQVLTKSSILLKVWGDDSFFNSRSMDVFISRLRKYLKGDSSVRIINLRGVGYKLVID